VRRLIVDLDAVAALREATGGAPPLAAAAALAAVAGAAGVRLGLSEELAPVGERDLREVQAVGAGLELRMAPIPSLVKAALEARPTRVVLASSAGAAGAPMPLDLRAWGSALAPSIRALEEAGLRVEALVGADLGHVKAAHAAGARGVELYTGSLVDLPAAERAEALARLGDAARLAAKLRLEVGVGGGLDERSLAPVLEAAPIAGSVAVGRAWVGRALLVGIDRATRDLREAIQLRA
jgi:pyridoxine 5'-phosphate synthase PdxJ